ncbi:hypothetical protein [Kineosporia succinea]|uniref:Thiosulfate dehydrogenase [quinone] large subunit n=1 Tax=Kineosporia succinea TaxID=84632 RepID=A0ABT9P3V9_9ACTN|nr:hypothetical protein [Kineosporia succinea]MDP9826760.1 thiosulfate dehydrogenase [quinone] large subunit [Kineosporia succinea]
MSIENAAPVESPSSASGLTSSAGPVGAAGAKNSTLSSGAAKLFAVLRILVGFIFLWASIDKTFGLGYSTSSEKAWINGNSPTKGFLGSIDQGPFASLFNNMAGNVVVDVLFILGMFAIGVAVIAGVAMKISAVSGSLIMAMMWLAEWPMAQTTGAGEPTGSTNPFMDYHIAYALVLFALVAVAAGKTWGLGNVWEKLPVVSSQKWMH